MIKSRHDTAFFQRSYSSEWGVGMTSKIRAMQQRPVFTGMT
ncbi:hypothetical protein [Rickettsia endosymbiont of Ceutorhynchus obstrictus]